MPDRHNHRWISSVGGLGVGLYLSRDCPAEVAVVRIGAALLGTRVGGALPDIIEPGSHSWHRKTAHSMAVEGTLTWMGMNPPSDVQGAVDHWEETARQLREQRSSLPANDSRRMGLWFKEMGLHAMIALLAGLILGYVLHLAADATTPRGLPII